MKTIVLISTVACLLSAAAWADGDSCQPRVEQPCFTVHGRLSAANGAPTFRIWIVGTHRILGVTGGEDPNLPSALRKKFGSDAFERDIFGDYKVCPATHQRPGQMQMVCVAGASKLTVRPR